jgi:hypothetical protein
MVLPSSFILPDFLPSFPSFAPFPSCLPGTGAALDETKQGATEERPHFLLCGMIDGMTGAYRYIDIYRCIYRYIYRYI